MKKLSFLNSTGFDTVSANSDSSFFTVNNSINRLKVWKKSSFVNIVSVADCASHLRSFSAHFTFSCHVYFPFIVVFNYLNQLGFNIIVSLKKSSKFLIKNIFFLQFKKKVLNYINDGEYYEKNSICSGVVYVA